MNKFIVAVSGGVDSVVLLDILSRNKNLELIIAHFDHGIRSDSAADAKFVKKLSKKYNYQFETKREELGRDASEEKARVRRYEFLWSVAKKHDAGLITAHHADDVIETVAINLIRGTGWRGLSAMDSEIIRPLTNLMKSEILDYAKQNNLKWREDSTNASDAYLRNRIRQKITTMSLDEKKQLLGLWNEQKAIKKQVNHETHKLVSDSQKYSRYFFIHIDEKSAMECIRHITEARLTRPQSYKALHAIKTAMPGKVFHAGGGVELYFTSRNFIVKLIK